VSIADAEVNLSHEVLSANETVSSFTEESKSADLAPTIYFAKIPKIFLR